MFEDSGHGADGAARAYSGAKIDGVDQFAGGDGGLAHQGAEGFGASEAAQARFRKANGIDCT
jgi:hypothetical protein